MGRHPRILSTSAHPGPPPILSANGGSLKVKRGISGRLFRKGEIRTGKQVCSVIQTLTLFLGTSETSDPVSPYSPLLHSPHPQAQAIPATPGSPGMCVPAQLGQKPCAAGTCAQGHAQGGLSRHFGIEDPLPVWIPQG